MPNRWTRNADNILVPKIPVEGINKESVKVLPAYSRTDDFGYATDAQVDLVYAAQTGDTLAYVATGTKDTTGAVAGNTAGFITLGAGNFVDPTKKLVFRAKVQLATADTELFGYIGCAETTPTAADPPVEADDFIGFTLVETTANANWQCVTATDLGTTETLVDSGVVVDLLTHDFEFTLEDGKATFKIDGNVVGSSITNIPVTTALVPQIKVTTGDTNVKAIIADVLSVQNDRA